MEKTERIKIGVLALQGAFAEHIHSLQMLGAKTFEIRQLKDLDCDFDGLVLPGGESSVQGKLLRDLKLFAPLQKLIRNGVPVFGTCAGLILIANKLSNDNRSYLGTLPVTVERNAYGRQLGSFRTIENFADVGKIPMTFIRAPLILKTNKDVQILARVKNQIVAVRYKNQLAISFHPELNEDLRIHRYFLEKFVANGIAEHKKLRIATINPKSLPINSAIV